MVIFFYLIYDLYFLLVVYFLSVCLASLFVLSFKNQFFFIFCLPYLSTTGVATLVFTNLLYAVSSYFLLFYIVFLLVYPVTLLLSSLVVFAPTFSSSTCYRVFLRGGCLGAFFVLLISWVLWFTLNFIGWLTVLGQTTNSRVIRFVFDFSAESWLTTFLAVLGLLLLLAILVSIFGYLILLDTQVQHVFWLRLLYCAIVILFLMFFLPYDAVLHVIVFLSCALLAEVLLLLRFLQISYTGRVA